MESLNSGINAERLKLDRACDAFEQQWSGENQPRIEDFLKNWEGVQRENALRELLSVELEIRSRRNEQLALQDYMERFPESESLIRSVFEELGYLQAGALTPRSTSASSELSEQSLPVAAEGQYEFLEEIARGGMGAIHRVRDTHFDRLLAIKTLREDRSYPRLRQRFLLEARVSGQLQHPGIPPVHDVGRLPDGELYFSMKLIEGETLQKLLDQRKQPAESRLHFLGVFEQICQTLAYAHSRQVIHRDLKPLNVMVGEFGEVQVMDWGMARQLTAESNQDSSTITLNIEGESAEVAYDAVAETMIPDTAPDETLVGQPVPASTEFPEERMTMAGEVMGTLAYMPPEQAKGKIDRLNKRSDVFGLGAILCQILTGQPPYTKSGGDYLHQAQQGHVQSAYARLDECGTDNEIIELCKQCLTPEQEGRPADAGIVAEVVREYLEAFQQRLETARLETVEAETRAQEERKRSRVVRMVALLTVLLILGTSAAGVWYYIFQDRQQREVAGRTNRAIGQVNTLTDDAEAQMKTVRDKLSDREQYQRLFNTPASWRQPILEARNSLDEAQKIQAISGIIFPEDVQKRWATLDQQVEDMANEYTLSNNLELPRLGHIVDNGPRIKNLRSPTFQLFDNHLKLFGWNFRQGRTPDLIRRIDQAGNRFALLEALDFWQLIEPDAELARKLRQITTALDDNDWRNSLREPAIWDNKEKLQELASQPEAATQPPAYLQMLSLLLVRQGITPTSLLHRAMSLKPKNFLLLYTWAIFSRDPRETLGAYRAALAVRSDVPPAHRMLGRILLQLGEKEAAVLEFQEVVRLTETGRYTSGGVILLGPYVELAEALISLERYEEAEFQLQKAFKQKPDYPPAWHAMGELREKQNRLPEAETAYRKAIRQNMARARINLARVLENQGKLKAALNELEQLLEISPDNSEVKTNIQRLNAALADQPKK